MAVAARPPARGPQSETLAQTRESRRFWAHYRLLSRVLTLQAAVTWWLRGAALGLLGVCAWLAAARVVALPALYPPLLLVPPVALGLLAALGAAVRRPPPQRVLRLADRKLGLAERLITAYELQAWPADHPQARTQLQDAVRHFTRREPLDEFPLRLPRRETVVVLGLAALALLLALAPNPFDARQRQQEQTRQAALQEAERLNRVLAELEQLEATEPEVGQARESLAEAARLLEQTRLTPEQQLAALAALEQRLAQLRSRDADRLEDGLAALAAALAAEPQTRELAAALARGDYERAAEELRRLAENARNLPEPERRQLGRALRGAGAAAARAIPGLGQQLERSGQAVEQGGGERELGDVADQVAEAGRELRSQEALERALSALQNSRSALGQAAGQRGSPRAGRDGPREAPGANEGPGQPEPGQDGQGTGQPGREPGGSQPGTGSQARTEPVYDPLFAPSRREQVPSQSEFKPDQALEDPQERGALGNEAQVGYQEVLPQYQERAARALENSYIPIGLKDLVREYFESLSPGR